MEQTLKEDQSTKFLELDDNVTIKTKLYKRRWLILILYVLYAGINAFQWFEYAIIANIVKKFYNVSAIEVDWTAIIYTALYMPMVIPASYLMERVGLRTVVIIGVTGTALGTIIKILSLTSERIWVTYVAQTILSSMQVFILALPPQIAAVWFGPKEASLACALGVFGTQFGQALGFVLPPMIVKNGSLEEIGYELEKLIKGLAYFTVAVTCAVYIYFPEKPPHPPLIRQESTQIDFSKTLKKLIFNKSFDFHAIAYGINIAVFISISTLLNRIMLIYFPNSEEDAGRIGLIMVIFGMIGSVAFGHILDKTHRYKETTMIIYILALVSTAALTYSLESSSKLFVYITGACFGLFTNSYMPIGLELGIELTYPEPESTSSGLLIAMTQTFGALSTLLLGWLLTQVGCFWALCSMIFLLFIGAVFTYLIENNMKRQVAFNCQINNNIVIRA